ncbi:MAG: UvrD-helicase domain-containing protein, partial [Kiritimatiellae bacterium]|nr:UvrD-helicase domain-containing protein [Kiritimatiellia bacterium]
MKSLSENILTPEFNTAGTNLIEASAGTGKTYSIQTLFLRLVITEGIPVQKILVVTFTEAATKELRERLRSIMEKCRLSSSLESDDPDKKRIKGILALELTPNHIP